MEKNFWRFQLPTSRVVAKFSNHSCFKHGGKVGCAILRSKKNKSKVILSSLGRNFRGPVRLAGLYTALSHLGKWAPLRWNLSTNEKIKERRIFSAESSFMILDMLKKNIRSESFLLDEVSKTKLSVAWKTETSYGFRDAWVAGVIGDHVLVVWLGNFDNSANPALVGREMTAPLFFDIVDLLKGKGLLKAADWELPMGLKIKSTDVCSFTDGFSRGACPHLKKTWFNPGISPIDECQVHREYLVSKKNGHRLCHFDEVTTTQKQVYEFWPSDIVQLFVKFGIPYKKAPPFEAGCDGDHGQASVPEIVSPKLDLIYSVRFNDKLGYEKIPFKAKVDQEIQKVFWFANQKPLGESIPSETMMAELSPGRYEISLVDDQGQVSTRTIQVQLIQ